jgi:hypothetical protein
VIEPTDSEHNWECSCGHLILGELNYCPACGASRTDPIQATEEELAEFIESTRQDFEDIKLIHAALIRGDIAEAQRLILENLKRHFPG